MTAARLRELQQISIFELVRLTFKFIRFELVHAGVAVGVFGAIFLILRPWNSDHYAVDGNYFKYSHKIHSKPRYISTNIQHNSIVFQIIPSGLSGLYKKDSKIIIKNTK